MRVGKTLNRSVIAGFLACAVMAWSGLTQVSESAPSVTVEDAIYQDAESQYALGLGFADKSSPGYDPVEAEKWLKRAAEQGHVEAQYQLGKLYGTGDISTDADYVFPLAFKWTEAAAVQGHVDAMYRLGNFHRYGTGTPADVSKAFFWFEKAAVAGHVLATRDMAQAFHWEGNGVDKNPQLAVYWYQKLAELGDAHAYFALGSLHADGSLGTRDENMAIRYFAEGARLEDAACQFVLGKRYLDGKGVQQDDNLALAWLHKAEANGDTDAPHWISVIRSRQQTATTTQSTPELSAYETGELIGIFLKAALAGSGTTSAPEPKLEANTQGTCRQRLSNGYYSCSTITDYQSCEMTGCGHEWDCWKTYQSVRSDGRIKTNHYERKRQFGKCHKPSNSSASGFSPDFVCDPETGLEADSLERLAAKVCK